MGKIHDRLKIPRALRIAQAKADLNSDIREARQIRDSGVRHALMQTLALKAKAFGLKGRWNLLCNVTQCLREPAVYYNRGSYAFYCQACAAALNHANRRDAEEFLGEGQKLCVLVATAEEAAKLHVMA